MRHSRIYVNTSYITYSTLPLACVRYVRAYTLRRKERLHLVTTACSTRYADALCACVVAPDSRMCAVAEMSSVIFWGQFVGCTNITRIPTLSYLDTCSWVRAHCKVLARSPSTCALSSLFTAVFGGLFKWQF